VPASLRAGPAMNFKIGKPYSSASKTVRFTSLTGYKRFLKTFYLFLFYLFQLNLRKIIVNHKKNIK
jgi:hypothetical protein